MHQSRAVESVLFVAAAGNAANDNDSSPSYRELSIGEYYFRSPQSTGGIIGGFLNFGEHCPFGALLGWIFSSIASSDTSYDIFNGTSMAAPHGKRSGSPHPQPVSRRAVDGVRGRISQARADFFSGGKTTREAGLTHKKR